MLHEATAWPQVENVRAIDQWQDQKHRRSAGRRSRALIAVQARLVLAPHQLLRRDADGRVTRRQNGVDHINRAVGQLCGGHDRVSSGRQAIGPMSPAGGRLGWWTSPPWRRIFLQYWRTWPPVWRASVRPGRRL